MELEITELSVCPGGAVLARAARAYPRGKQLRQAEPYSMTAPKTPPLAALPSRLALCRGALVQGSGRGAAKDRAKAV